MDWGHALKPRADVSRRQARALVAAIAALHLAGAWALLQVPEVRQAVMNAAPLMVELLAPPAPPPEAPPPPPSRQPVPVPQAAPVLAAPSPAPLPAEAFTVPPPPPVKAEPVVEAAPVVAAAPPAPAPAPAPPPPPSPPARKRVDATSVTYLNLPPVEVPVASRRAGESGVVWLRVVVDTRGQPALVQVQRSSGHARLDEQAVWAMRQARFKPHTEDGTAIEVEVIAPIEYLLD